MEFEGSEEIDSAEETNDTWDLASQKAKEELASKQEKSCLIMTIKVLIMLVEASIFLMIVSFWDVLIIFDIVAASVYAAMVKFLLILLVFTPAFYRFCRLFGSKKNVLCSVKVWALIAFPLTFVGVMVHMNLIKGG